jgi:hypothetical protein
MAFVGTHLNTFHDASGKITVAVYKNVGNQPEPHFIEQEVLVGDGDMIAIGGGGVGIENPGAMLTASHPNNDLSGWVVSSKDHEIDSPHQLITYVIGLKIAGMTRAQLHSSVFVSINDSGSADHTDMATGIPNDQFVMVGGGFRVDWSGAGNLGTASFPDTETTWRARSQDADIADPANLRVYAMCLRRNLPVGQIHVSIGRADSIQAPHPFVVANVAPGFALVGGGAEVRTAGPGNYLWKLEPSTDNSPTFSAAAKDHIHPSPGVITAYAMGIRL